MITTKFSKRKVIFYRGNKIVIGGLTNQNKIDILLYVSRKLLNISDEMELWKIFFELCTEIFEPDKIDIYVPIFENNSYIFYSVFEKNKANSNKKNSESYLEDENSNSKIEDKIVRSVFETKEPFLIMDLKNHYNTTGSVICVPVQFKEEVFGILLIKKEIPYFYKKDDKEILLAISSQIAIYLTQLNLLKNLYESNKRIQHDLKIGKKIQKLIIHSHYLPWNGIYFYHYYEPMSEISGDYLRIFRNENYIFIFICDVSGHGIPSGMITMVIHQILESIISKFKQPQDIIKNLNDMIKPYLPDGVYVTAQLLKIYNDYHFELINSGHTPLFLFDSEKEDIIEMDTNGIPLGITEFNRDDLDIQTGILKPGDVLIFYTDGFIEQRNSEGEQFGLSRLKDTFLEEILYFRKKSHTIDPESLANSFFLHFDEFMSDSLAGDDMSLIIAAVSSSVEELNKNFNNNSNFKNIDFKKIYQKERSIIKNLYFAGIYYLKNKNYEEAENYIREYIKYTEPETPLFYLYLGYCLYQQGKYKESRKYLRIVLSKQLDNKKAAILLIKSYLMENQIEKAKYYHKQFLKDGLNIKEFLGKVNL